MKRFVVTNFQDYEAVFFKCVYKALIVETIRRSIHSKELEMDEVSSKYFFKGHWWMQDSISAWEDRFPYLSNKTIRRYLQSLQDSEYLIAATSHTKLGRQANFYRINPDLDLFLKVHKAKSQAVKSQEVNLTFKPDDTQEVNLTIAKGSNCPSLQEVKMTPCLSITNISSDIDSNIAQDAADGGSSLSSKPKKQKVSEWDESDEYAQIFKNLMQVPSCRRNFNREKYREWLKEISINQAVNTAKLVELSNEWQKYWNGATEKPKSIRASFENWVKNHFKWGKDNGNNKRKANSRVDYSADNGKFEGFDDNKPW